ncbi:Cytochrome P450 monooxygenase [Psilocybe cubensis]|uniref:Cytochrome P450 monooxygenase n=1 Tax=Psilocybe cubensis TaxID=181762 RepID=A0ACB8GLG4_PSICU|nr:Cytochrome P450 monooxygenase [Psilocybe cubensis]KAH9476386.1 Cytochrome P450 monooxygenase [Psilocybe cubensis]
MKNPQLVSSVVFAVIGWLVYKLINIGRRDKTLPPGPPTAPLVGNAHLLPSKFAFLKFSEWGRQYGGIFSIKLANATMIVVSDMKVVKELLDDRSSETSSRPFSFAVHSISKGYFALTSSDNPLWKASRKSIQPFLSAGAIQSHVSISDKETTQLLYDILNTPESLCAHVFRCTFSSAASLAFGRRVLRHDSSEAILFEQYLRNFVKTVSPESAPVDLIPILRYIPESIAPWGKVWRETRQQQQSIYYFFFEHTLREVNAGNKKGTIIEAIVKNQEELGLTQDAIAYIGGMLLDAGSETSATTIQSLILSLLKFPACLKKAQEEIDELIGDSRLPISTDIDELPYVQAVIKEGHRLRPAVPCGIPHAALNDCHYRGYTIPKGSPILINIWGILHDPELFDRPDEFRPERYLETPDGTIPGLKKDFNIRLNLPFGSGKRLCPGMNFSNIFLNLAVMRLLWAFDFTPYDDLTTNHDTWDIEKEYSEGITLTPKNLRCKITPRNEKRARIIQNSYKEA